MLYDDDMTEILFDRSHTEERSALRQMLLELNAACASNNSGFLHLPTLPQVAEGNFPRRKDAAAECLLYDEFTVCSYLGEP